MKKILLLSLILLGISSCTPVKQREKEPMIIQYQSRYREPIVRNSVFSHLDKSTSSSSFLGLQALKEGFTLTFPIHLKSVEAETMLLNIPEILEVKSRLHQREKWQVQNYPSYPMPDGSIPVLEACLWLEDEAHDIRPLTVGLPLALLQDPYGKHDVCLQFTGVEWSIYVDGRLYDNDFAIGYPREKAFQSWGIDPQKVEGANLYIPALALKEMASPTPVDTFNIQFWTPPYHNAWVGDVATIYHEGRYHVFYLFDRRGHGSKFGKGGHYFEHLSTTDFKHWTEHKAATPIEHQWESFGTGTPFIYNGKLCLSYGLHTTRIYPREQTTLPMQWKYLEENGHTGSFNYDTIPHLMPAGSTYSVSEDGISNFQKTHLLIHPCENPSIYTTSDGSLKMLANYGARGTWASDSVTGGWKCINEHFPIGGDCTFPFHWNGYDYIIGGFSRLWYKETQETDSAYIDMVKQGIDFYNGMSVPSITEIADNRFLMAAWIKTEGWGGPLVIHELIQHPDGRIGNKWMEEIVPVTHPAVTLAHTVNQGQSMEVPEQPFILTFEVHPVQKGIGQMAITFQNHTSQENACEWQMQLDKERAQFAPASTQGFAPDQKTLREGGDVSTAQNYAIENGMKFDRPFTVRMLIQPSAKARGTLMDVEIGAQRTMLSYRPFLFVDQLKFHLKDVEIKNLNYAILK